MNIKTTDDLFNRWLEKMTGRCPQCGTEFLKTSPIQIYCNPKCGMKARDDRRQRLVDIGRQTENQGNKQER